MAVITSSAKIAYERATASREPMEPRIPEALNELFQEELISTTHDPFEAIEVRNVSAEETSLTDFAISGGRFVDCSFQSCSFVNAEFVDIIFKGCDFSNSIFNRAAFVRCLFQDCKFAGASFMEALWEQVLAKSCLFSYGTFDRCRWKVVRANSCDFSAAEMTEMNLTSTQFNDDRFMGTNFFRTKLVGLDLTSCQLREIILSDDMHEVYGTKLDLYQAAALAQRLGVIIEE